ncbi:hypothetical protein ABZ628_22015 [Streptomyces diastaticus]
MASQRIRWPNCREPCWDNFPEYAPGKPSHEVHQQVKELLRGAALIDPDEVVIPEEPSGPSSGTGDPVDWAECGETEHQRLCRRRAWLYERRTNRIERPPVIVYARALVKGPMNEPTWALRWTRRWAERRFHVAAVLWDQPESREHLDMAQALCRRGHACGIVSHAPDNYADTPAEYEARLDYLEARGFFLQHPPHDWGLA